RMLMHSPPLAEGWLSFFTAIRQKCGLSGKIREMVILRIASIHGASYEFAAHEPFGLREGLTPTQIEALKTGNLDAFDAKERAILTDYVTIAREIDVPDAVCNNAREYLSASAMVEVTATIAAYNLV